MKGQSQTVFSAIVRFFYGLHCVVVVVAVGLQVYILQLLHRYSLHLERERKNIYMSTSFIYSGKFFSVKIKVV